MQITAGAVGKASNRLFLFWHIPVVAVRCFFKHVKFKKFWGDSLHSYMRGNVEGPRCHDGYSEAV